MKLAGLIYIRTPTPASRKAHNAKSREPAVAAKKLLFILPPISNQKKTSQEIETVMFIPSYTFLFQLSL